MIVAFLFVVARVGNLLIGVISFLFGVSSSSTSWTL